MSVEADVSPLKRKLSSRRHRRKLREFEERLTSVLTDPPFPLYGLDASWRGRRWPAGVGSTGAGVGNVELGHGDPHDHDAPEIRVTTRPPGSNQLHTYASTAQELVHGLWHDGMDHTSAIRAPFTVDPTASWEDLAIPVGSSTLDFKMLRSDRTWVALGVMTDHSIVSITAHNAEPDVVRLVLLDDLSPYLSEDSMPWNDPPES